MAIVGQSNIIGGADKKYEQPFVFESSVTITHNLWKKPSVTVIDTAGSQVIWKVNYTSDNELTVSFSAPFSWTVFCN